VPLAVLLAATGPWLVPGFYGSEFAPAAPVLALLLAGMGLSQVLFWTRPAILALGRPDFALRLTMLNAAVKVSLVLLLIPALGALGMAALTASLFALGALLSTRFVARALRQAPSRAPRRPVALPEPDALAGEIE
jgi:O-antigen/teichoic acid export membrane protein